MLVCFMVYPEECENLSMSIFRSKKGSTYTELIIFIIIAAIVVFLAFQVYYQGIIFSHEASALLSLQLIRTLEEQFRLSHPEYGMLDDLKSANLFGEENKDLASGSKNGYLFQAMPSENSQYEWYAEAIPRKYDSSGTRSFYIDETGLIRSVDFAILGFVPREQAILWNPMQ